MKKLAIVTTHPIQYNAPFFKLLTERGKVRLRVFYTWPQAIDGFDDPDFGKKVKWDIPLLEGYDWEAVVNISKKPSSKSWSGIDCPQLNKRIEAFNPDAILVYGWNLKSHFMAMRYFKGKIPVWFFGDSTLLDEQPGIRKMLRRLWLTWVYRHVDKAFYVGTNNKNYYQAHGLREDQLVFFPHAVDNERFFDNEEKQYETKAQQWREELGYKRCDIVILFTGKFEPRKNLLFFLDCIEQISKLNNQTNQFLFIGNGPQESVLKLKVSELNNVKFLPYQNQSLMPVVYRLGDYFCLPSKSETWGLAVNEAMACRRPVLVSNKVGCSIDLVNSKINGEIFVSNNVDDCIEKIRALTSYCKKIKGSTITETIIPWSFENKCKALENAFNEDSRHETR